MEAKRVKRDVKALLGEYVGQRLRENGFDPKGKGTATMLDELAHYDLAISMALWWLNKDKGKTAVKNDIIGIGSPCHSHYPNHLEREAMILSSFAGMLLNSLPIQDILSLYNCKPSASYSYNHNKQGNIVHPFSLSYHPFAMLSSFKAVEHSRQHTLMLNRRMKEQNKQKTETDTLLSPSTSSSSSSSFSDSEDSLQPYEGSQESLQD